MWILDHLEAVQEYSAAVNGAADVKLFTPDPALQWRQWDDRNDEFWGHQFFVGENPPTQAVLQLYFKKAVSDASLRFTDAAGKVLREMSVGGNRSQAGIEDCVLGHARGRDWRRRPGECGGESRARWRTGRRRPGRTAAGWWRAGWCSWCSWWCRGTGRPRCRWWSRRHPAAA
jgi:hypothetical protein